MNITHYIFAFFVFLLVCAAIWFYGKVTRPDKKKDKDGYEKEQRLFKLYQNIEDMLGGFEEYAEEAKAGIDERLRQAEALIESMKSAPEQKSKPEPEPEPEPEPKPERAEKPARVTAASAKEPQISAGSAGKKPKAEELIPQYVAKGMSKEEIARTLGISLREVSLIMQIKKMNAPGGEA